MSKIENIALGNDRGQEIVRRLGLEGLHVTDVEIEFPLETAASATVRILLTEEQVDALMGMNDE